MQRCCLITLASLLCLVGCKAIVPPIYKSFTPEQIKEFEERLTKDTGFELEADDQLKFYYLDDQRLPGLQHWWMRRLHPVTPKDISIQGFPVSDFCYLDSLEDMAKVNVPGYKKGSATGCFSLEWTYMGKRIKADVLNLPDCCYVSILYPPDKP